MQLEVRLLHCDGGSRVVLVSAREGERLLGSALGEAEDAEEAEDRARARLLARLESSGVGRPAHQAVARRPERSEPPAARPSPTPAPASPDPPPEASGVPPAAPPPAAVAPDRREEDPQDWSAELAELDLQMRRLGWDREREATYLQRAFGHPSRDRITVYADLMAYLQAIEVLEPGSDPANAGLPLRRSELLEQCNRLLRQLGWDGTRGRSFLERHLGVSSRQQLKDGDLLRFNMLLEEETLKGTEQELPAPDLEA
jgi:hypothetical protein